MTAGGRVTSRPGARSTRGRPVRGGPQPPPRRWLLPVIMSVVTAVVLAAYFTPVLGVREVRVEGLSSVPERTAVDAAGVELGTPMLQLDTEAVRARLAQLPEVASAEVHLRWPSTVRLQVTERRPVAYMPGANPNPAANGVQLVDAAGVVFRTVPQPPAGLTRLRLGADRAAGVREAMSALTALPAGLRGQVVEVVAERPQDLHLELVGGRRVDWGGSAEAERKAAVLPALLTRPGRIYDVTSPSLSTVTE